MKSILSGILGLVVILISSCTYDPAKLEIEVRSLTSFPQYFCSGETVHFRYDGYYVEEVILLKNDDTLLLKMITPHSPNEMPVRWQGAGITPPMKKEWLPLTVNVRLYDSDKLHSHPYPSEKLVNIDQEEWTERYYNQYEIGDEPFYVHQSTTQEYDSATGSVINVKFYEVKRNFYGYRWRIPYEHSSKATLVKLMNLGEKMMTFTIAGVQGEYQLAPNQESPAMPIFKHPSGLIIAKYDPPEIRTIAYQKGEITKPENEHFSYENVYMLKESPIKLLIRCKNN